jgi:hypothetical protein
VKRLFDLQEVKRSEIWRICGKVRRTVKKNGPEFQGGKKASGVKTHLNMLIAQGGKSQLRLMMRLLLRSSPNAAARFFTGGNQSLILVLA